MRNAAQVQPGPGLNVVVGNATHPADVARAVATPFEVVISALGGGARAEGHVCSVGAHLLTRALPAETRLLAVSSLGVEPQYLPPFSRHVVIPYLLRQAHEDLEVMERYLETSTLRWTVARPPRLTNGPLTGRYRDFVLPAADVPTQISRADLAHFLLRLAENDGYPHQKPVAGY